MTQFLSSYEEELQAAKMPAGKKKVLATALKLFANNGFHATTTAAIARQAGVSEGTIYKYFSSKEDLLGRLLEPILLEIKDNFFANIDYPDQLADFIHLVITNRLQFIEANFDFIRLILQEVLTNQVQGSYYRKFFSGENGVLAKVLEMQSRYPAVDQSLTAPQMIRAFVGPVLVYTFQTQIFGIPRAENDLAIIERQVLCGLTNN